MKRILVAGGGLIGSRHCEAIARHPKCTLAGLADPNPAIRLDAPRYGSIAEAPDDIDGIVIATPTALHHKVGIEAAERGWHLLIEKPVAADLTAATALQTALTKTGVAALVGHHRRYHAPVRQLKQLLDDGAIGTPVTATTIWAMRKPDQYFAGNWRAAGGSPVMINIVHDIDLLRFLLGEIDEVCALGGQRRREAPRVESGAIALAFASGATATISFADTAPSPWGFEAGTGENPNIGTSGQDMLWITGTEGAISFPSMTHWRGADWSQAASKQDLTVETNSAAPLDMQLDHFLEVMDGAPPLCSLADATQTLSVTLSLENQIAAQNAPDPAHQTA